jgi:iron complex outermembrane receptor protein
MIVRSTMWFGLVCVAGAPLSAFAQSAPQAGTSDQLEEVIVTAERRVSDVQKTADSITVRTGDELVTEGKYQLSQILEDIPGVAGGASINTSLSSNTAGTDAPSAGITIRGIPSNVGGGGQVVSVAPAAAYYSDGVYEGIGGNYDIDRVEVVRGPVGTLYGRSATSGLVAVHTADPLLDTIGGNALLEYGSYALEHYAAALSVPLVDDVLAVRVSGNRFQRNGYLSPEQGEISNSDGKVKVLFKPNEGFSLLLGAALEDNSINGGGANLGIKAGYPNTIQYQLAGPAPGGNQARQYWAEMNWNLGVGTLTYEPAYRTFDESFVVGSLPSGALSLDQTGAITKDHFLTHELRLASNPGSKITWQVGTLYFSNDQTAHDAVNVTAPPPLVGSGFNSVFPVKDTEDLAAFAEATIPLAESWRVTAGLRYDYSRILQSEDYTAYAPAILGIPPTVANGVFNLGFHNTTYKIRLEHDLTAQSLLYASVSTAFSPGDQVLGTVPNTSAGAPPGAVNVATFPIAPEVLTAYELGSKNRFLDNKLQVNGALYYYHYGAYQLDNVSIAPPGQPPEFAPLGIPVEVFGGELETLYQVTAHDILGLNLGYSNAYFVQRATTNFGDVSPPLPATTWFSRNGLPNVIPFTANLSYRHIIVLPGSSTLSLHGDVRYLSAHDAGNLPSADVPLGYYPYIRQDGAEVGDIDAMWAMKSPNLSMTAYVRNVGNNQYKTSAAPGAGVGFLATEYDPRTLGVVVNWRF